MTVRESMEGVTEEEQVQEATYESRKWSMRNMQKDCRKSSVSSISMSENANRAKLHTIAHTHNTLASTSNRLIVGPRENILNRR
jgi:hypothetical protein